LQYLSRGARKADFPRGMIEFHLARTNGRARRANVSKTRSCKRSFRQANGKFGFGAVCDEN
jgi:hypothetical protein